MPIESVGLGPAIVTGHFDHRAAFFPAFVFNRLCQHPSNAPAAHLRIDDEDRDPAKGRGSMKRDRLMKSCKADDLSAKACNQRCFRKGFELFQVFADSFCIDRMLKLRDQFGKPVSVGSPCASNLERSRGTWHKARRGSLFARAIIFPFTL